MVNTTADSPQAMPKPPLDLVPFTFTDANSGSSLDSRAVLPFGEFQVSHPAGETPPQAGLTPPLDTDPSKEGNTRSLTEPL